MMRADALRRSMLFAGLDAAELEAIAALAREIRAERGRIIVQEGASGHALYLILAGMVKICSFTADGREVVLALLGPGAFFGEIALVDRKPRSASVIALEPTRLAQIRGDEFERLLLDKPQLALKVMRELASRLRQANQALARITGLDAPHRVYAWLVDHAHRFGTADGHGRIVQLPPHQLIADQISTSRETVSRVLSRLRQSGLIEPAGGHRKWRVDVEQLAAMVEAAQ